MNTTTPYEQLIAAKLDQAPVPDMADGIWSNIEMQLDAPADAPAKKPSPKYKGKGWYGLIGLTAVVALLWWFYNHKSHSPENAKPPKALTPANQPPPVEPPGIADSNTSMEPLKKKSSPLTPVKIKKDTMSFHHIPNDNIGVDSAAKQILSPPANVDSSYLQNDKVPLPDADLYRVQPPPTLPPKKYRGVKGITSDDYKISAGKDSGRKKN